MYKSLPLKPTVRVRWAVRQLHDVINGGDMLGRDANFDDFDVVTGNQHAMRISGGWITQDPAVSRNGSP